MRNRYTRVFTLALVLALDSVASGGNRSVSYLPEINFRDKEVIRENREVRLDMTIDMSELRLRAQHTVALVPVLVSKDGNLEQAFPPVVIDGRTRGKVYLRSECLKSVDSPPFHDSDAQAIICLDNRRERNYEYTASLPYKRWMLDGRIEIREYVSGCLNCGLSASGQAMPEASPALASFTPEYVLETMVPKPEPVKVREEIKTARLQFIQNSREIDPSYKNNKAELDSVFRSIDMVKTDPDLIITGIYITGYASPEGSESYNRQLSQDRAEALAGIAMKDSGLDASLWHVDGFGEDWAGLREEVLKHPLLLDIERTLDIIDNGPENLDARERALRERLPKETFQRLVNEMYGPVRRNEYRIEYKVRNFDIKEAAAELGYRPELLSVEEIYKVAGTFAKDSDEYREAILTAARIYPDNVAARVNAAYVELESGDTAEAIARLEGSEAAGIPEAMNILGVSYARNGEYDKALEILGRAKAAGSEAACMNVRQIERLLEDF